MNTIELLSGGVRSFINSVPDDCQAIQSIARERVWENRGWETWDGRHAAVLDRNARGDVDLIFIGDSIVHGWNEHGEGHHVWQQVYEPLKAVNLGFGGDQTQNVNWRLDNGEIDGIAPKVALLMIGTNNCWQGASYLETAAGVESVCRRLRQKLPQAKILLLAVFPRDSADKWADANVVLTNKLISGLADGEWIHYLDISSAFRDERGRLQFDLMPDGIHPSEQGYEAWAKAINPKLSELMDCPIPQYQ